MVPPWNTKVVLNPVSAILDMAVAVLSGFHGGDRTPRPTLGHSIYDVRIEGVKKYPKYSVTHLVANLGWVDFDLGCSTILLGQ